MSDTEIAIILFLMTVGLPSIPPILLFVYQIKQKIPRGKAIISSVVFTVGIAPAYLYYFYFYATLMLGGNPDLPTMIGMLLLMIIVFGISIFSLTKYIEYRRYRQWYILPGFLVALSISALISAACSVFLQPFILPTVAGLTEIL